MNPQANSKQSTRERLARIETKIEDAATWQDRLCKKQDAMHADLIQLREDLAGYKERVAALASVLSAVISGAFAYFFRGNSPD